MASSGSWMPWDLERCRAYRGGQHVLWCSHIDSHAHPSDGATLFRRQRGTMTAGSSTRFLGTAKRLGGGTGTCS
eukprot:7593489-Pyramimonas_sp.AAC.1